MLIGELSRKTGLSRDTIRFYEKRGLIVADPPESEFNTYKNYTPENERRLELIKTAKGFGFTLNEVKTLLELLEMNQVTCDYLQSEVESKLKMIEQKILELKQLKSTIKSKLKEAQAQCICRTANCQMIVI